MAAAAAAMANRHIVSTTLDHLSNMKYKDRRQYGPDQPVEFLEFRPTLVPAILVNRLWADEGTGILWRGYPHVPALKGMSHDRRQYYASKVQHVFTMSPSDESTDTLDYLQGLEWPKLETLEFEVDFRKHGEKFASMLHGGLKHLEVSGFQSGGSQYFSDTVLPALFSSCKNLNSIRISSDTIMENDPLPVSSLFNHLDSVPSMNNIAIKSANFTDTNALFARLSQRPGLESLEIDLDPGFALLPLLAGPKALPSPFSSLKRMWMMCYPEIALALPTHLRVIEDLQLEIARIPNQPAQPSDSTLVDDLIDQLSHCANLRMLKVTIGLLANDFPSLSTFPTLSGKSLVKLAESCPKLDDINLLTTEPSAIDGSDISSEDLDDFCRALPQLRNLSLKLHPPTVTALTTTALHSLGTHCPELEVIRLKLSFALPSLPVPSSIPQILINGEGTPQLPTPEDWVETRAADTASTGSGYIDLASPASSTTSAYIPPLFPKLTHLAIARPETALCAASDTFTVSSGSHSASSHVDADLEEDLVRSWAHPLLTHFPRLETLEAWSDYAGVDNESLHYFLPLEEILASTWEFLSGVEQDLWEDDDGEDDGEEMESEEVGVDRRESWHTWDSGEDWDKASLMNEFVVTEHEMGKLALFEEEPEGMITPVRHFDDEKLFTEADILDGIAH